MFGWNLGFFHIFKYLISIRRAISDRNHSRVSSFSRHFQGAFLHGDYPGLKPG